MTDSDDQIAIDLNVDFGESASQAGCESEDALIGFVSSVNIACGGHIGGECSMRRAVRSALRHGVAIGAHPSFPDRANFGRTVMDIDAEALRGSLAGQISSLHAIARSEGATLTHCKPHGALYHAASTDESIARVVLEACADVDAGLRLVARAGSRAGAWWRAWGAVVIEEGFADRVYNSDSTLRSRALPDSLIEDPRRAALQAHRIATTRSVVSSAGDTVSIRADTICIHSDTAGAVRIAEEIARSLRAAGVAIRAFV